MLIGVIADDMTGATDIALMLSAEGMRTVQLIGVPSNGALPEADAVVVALKSRTAPVNEAIAESLASLEALLAAGAQQVLFKYCSTFDSTPAGNIGPVSDALMERMGVASAIICPAFPANKRTIYQGHLFVGAERLDDSPMRNHPLTPMRDSSLIRLMAAQTPHRVGLVPFETVAQGAAAIAAALHVLERDGVRYVVTDAVSDDHLYALGEALAGVRYLTGGSGIAKGLPANFRRAGVLKSIGARPFVAPEGRSIVLSGSCSSATNAQVAHAIAQGVPALAIDPLALASGQMTAEQMAKWAQSQPGNGPALIYSTAEPDRVRMVQDQLGREAAGALVERALAETARRLADAGYRRFVIAGGETSGAVVQGLAIGALEIGPMIDPGVPWTRVLAGPDIAITLKSGNFGTVDFFTKALAMLRS